VIQNGQVAAGEVLPPLNGTRFSPTHTNEHLNYIATLLDDMFRIPGTRIRFGLDAIIGWVPGIGDAIAGLASLLIIFVAWKRGAPRITLTRMVANVLLETGVGMIPIVGDVAHIAWKSNRRNFNLLIRERERPRQHKWRDWVFIWF
jgi:Domain of unknown function (DUF4112)